MTEVASWIYLSYTSFALAIIFLSKSFFFFLLQYQDKVQINKFKIYFLFVIFSERELTFTFVIRYRPSVCLQRSCTLLRRLKFSAIFLRHLLPWPSVTFR